MSACTLRIHTSVMNFAEKIIKYARTLADLASRQLARLTFKELFPAKRQGSSLSGAWSNQHEVEF